MVSSSKLTFVEESSSSSAFIAVTKVGDENSQKTDFLKLMVKQKNMPGRTRSTNRQTGKKAARSTSRHSGKSTLPNSAGSQRYELEYHASGLSYLVGYIVFGEIGL